MTRKYKSYLQKSCSYVGCQSTKTRHSNNTDRKNMAKLRIHYLVGH